ncbi:hypothetical protein [Deinococcus kurensis]|uniref:hypothetical protein n=1 Tax=Deinococcus kurensis TaxID=2662757 RepID=UPI0012D2E309|nr:hypothetical protein [Deinococcus kurensis]
MTTNLTELISALSTIMPGRMPDGFADGSETDASYEGQTRRVRAVNLWVAWVWVHMEAAEARWPELRAAIEARPDLDAALTGGDIEQTRYIVLGGMLGDQGLALRLMAILIALGRARRIDVMSLGGGEADTPELRQAVVNAAGRGLLSVADVRLT